VIGRTIRVGGRRAYLGLRYNLLPRLGHVLMARRSPYALVSRWPDAPFVLGPRVCVYVHWDSGGDVRDHVLNQLRSLHEAGVSTVFVTNAGRLRPSAMDALRPLVAAILIRANVGYDFCAWREGLEQAALPRPDTEMVLLANDSVYGPLRPLGPLLDRINFEQAECWGATESWQHRYHLQSYLMAFSPAVVAGDAWREFWLSVRPTWSKNWLIRLYEIGLTQAMLKAGYRCRALWPYAELSQAIDPMLLSDDEDLGINLADPAVQVRRVHTSRIRGAAVQRQPLNPTSDLWRQLLAAGYPFLKRELLRDNPTFVPDIGDWREVVRAIGVPEAITEPIERDLQRTLKDRSA